MASDTEMDEEGAGCIVTPEVKKRKTSKSPSKAFLMSHVSCDFIPPKPLEWSSLPVKFKKSPYTTIFGNEDDESISSHNDVLKVEALHRRIYNRGANYKLSSADWSDLVNDALRAEKDRVTIKLKEDIDQVKKVITRFAITRPEDIFKIGEGNYTNLCSSSLAWQAAVKKVGCQFPSNYSEKTKPSAKAKNPYSKKQMKVTLLDPRDTSTWKFKHRFDITIKIEAEPTDNRTQLSRAMAARLREWFTQVQRTDKNIFIAPWREGEGRIVTTPSEIPDKSMEWQVYFNRCRPPTASSGFKAWGSVFLVSDSDFKPRITRDSENDISAWYEETGCCIYPKSLDDAASPVVVGMLAFSGPFTDKDTVKKDLDRCLTESFPDLVNKIGVKKGKLQKNVFPFNESTIDTWKCNVFRDPRNVIQLEADSIYSESAKKACYCIYNKDRISVNRFLFIPNPSLALLTEKGRDKFNSNFQRHVKDMMDIVSFEVSSIKFLDEPLNAQNNITLRKILMDYKDKEGGKIFHHIDIVEKWIDASGVVKRVMVYPEKCDAAKTIMDLLSSYVIKEFGNDARLWFTKEELIRKDSVRLEGDSFVTEDDEEMDLLLAVNDRAIVNLDVVVKQGEKAKQNIKRSTDQTLYSHSSYVQGSVSSDDETALDTCSGGISTLTSEQAKQIEEQQVRINELQRLVDELLKKSELNKNNAYSREVSGNLGDNLHKSDDVGGTAWQANTNEEAAGSTGGSCL